MRAKQKGLTAMHVKVEELRRQQIRTAQRIITLREKEKMTCQKTQSEASQTPQRRAMEPLPKAQERKAARRNVGDIQFHRSGVWQGDATRICQEHQGHQLRKRVRAGTLAPLQVSKLLSSLRACFCVLTFSF